MGAVLGSVLNFFLEECICIENFIEHLCRGDLIANDWSGLKVKPYVLS